MLRILAMTFLLLCFVTNAQLQRVRHMSAGMGSQVESAPKGFMATGRQVFPVAASPKGRLPVGCPQDCWAPIGPASACDRPHTELQGGLGGLYSMLALTAHFAGP